MMEMPIEKQIENAVQTLRAGDLVVFPTETVYGLGADATNANAIAKIFALKNRPSFNPLIVHVASRSMAEELVEFNSVADRLAEKFWAGALTLVLPKKKNCPIPAIASAGLDTLAIRVPAHPIAHKLLTKFGKPIVAPSANISGKISPTEYSHISFKNIPILHGEKCEIGLESTVIDATCELPTILRHGFITEEEVIKTVGELGVVGGKIKSPGMMQKHYSPTLPVRLNITEPKADEAFLAFGNNSYCDAKYVLNLSPSGDLIEAAANLFSMLHELDKPTDFSAIAVMPIPDVGIGKAINDRLMRASV